MERDFNGPVRAIVADKFSDMGTIVIGKMESGVVVKNQNLILMPNRVSHRFLFSFLFLFLAIRPSDANME